jgi:signal transduction histidine kinase
MQLKQWVTDLVDLGALQSGAFRLRLGPVQVKALIDGCIEVLLPEAQAKGLSMESGIEAGVSDIIQADESRLRQVLLILLDNAVKVSEQGCVSLTARRGGHCSGHAIIRQSAMLAGAWMEFHVTDTGPGLSEADQVKILNVFSRMDSAGRGTGLSVALAARLCAAMGGLLTVQSDAGNGSTFVVRVPLGLLSEVPVSAEEELAPAPALPGGA